MHEYTTPDIRDLDCLYLATIGGADYYELRSVVRRQDGVQTLIGRASDWPLIAARAQLAELTALLTASERRSVEADCHVVELLARLDAYEAHIAAIEAALTEAAAERTAAEIAAAPTVFVVEPVPPQVEQLVARLKSPATESPDTRRKCSHCNARPKLAGMQAHIERTHPDQVQVARPGGRAGVAAPPTAAAPIALELGEAPWRCASCGKDAHARSLERPAICKKCLAESVDAHLSNGHLAAA